MEKIILDNMYIDMRNDSNKIKRETEISILYCVLRVIFSIY